MPLKHELAPDHRRVAAELALPERIADYRSRGGAARLVVAVAEYAAQQRRHAEHAEKVTAYPEGAAVTRLAARCQVPAPTSWVGS